MAYSASNRLHYLEELLPIRMCKQGSWYQHHRCQSQLCSCDHLMWIGSPKDLQLRTYIQPYKSIAAEHGVRRASESRAAAKFGIRQPVGVLKELQATQCCWDISKLA